MTLPTDPRAELRMQRALLISAIRDVEHVIEENGDGVIRVDALSRLLELMREHLLLAAFVDRTDTDPAPRIDESRCNCDNGPHPQHQPYCLALQSHDTDRPPADPTLVTCTGCNGTGYVHGDNLAGVKVCSDCYGQGCT